MPLETGSMGAVHSKGPVKREVLPDSNGSLRKAKAVARHILVVDDDEMFRRMVASSVARVGYRVDMARDGEEGWKALCMKAYDLIITDNNMPKLNGLGLIRRLRSVSDEPPCILMSGDLPLPEPALQKIIQRGAVLEKPFSRRALIEKVYGLLLHGDCSAL